MRNILIAILLLALIIKSYSQDVPIGVYCRTNQAGDYAITEIVQLNCDSTFSYEFIGHMFHFRLVGKYIMKDNGVIDYKYDSTKVNSQMDSIELAEAPKQMKVKNDKLFHVDKDGHIIKTQKMLSDHRRFLLFGKYIKRRKTFLIKKDDRGACH